MQKIILAFLFLLTLAQINGHTHEKNNRIESLPIHIFIHICTINHWQDVVERQLSKIKASGLYEQCDSISFGVLGNGDVSSLISRYPKVKVLFQTIDKELYERPTLLNLHSQSRSDPTALVLYLHSKGVSRSYADANITDWSDYMEYFTIECWRDCVEELNDYDVCGVNWRTTPLPHFSGNFWWARADYITSLPGHIGRGYYDPEMWIGLRSPTVKCFHATDFSHYDHPYPAHKYKVAQDPYIVALTPQGSLGQQLQKYWNLVLSSKFKHRLVVNRPPLCKLTSFFSSTSTKIEFKQSIQDTLDEMKGSDKRVYIEDLIQSHTQFESDYILLSSPFINQFIKKFVKKQHLPESIDETTNQMTLPLSNHKFLNFTNFSQLHKLQNEIDLNVSSEWAISIYKLNGKKLTALVSCPIN